MSVASPCTRQLVKRISVDIAPGELVEQSLDAMIERRSRHNPEREREEMYMESVRKYHTRNRKQIRAEWYAYFRRIAESLRRRAEEYDRRAEALMEEQSEPTKG
jgi:16S rRNA A1518/A1519 N6-dimethyltransferase RsmA/KsgA/DIM1 with predicted DNA glycosylase/AP lyase activity